ncbi:MAG: hypothetical protein NZL93_03475, partial [Chthoniobacterales bacterium]|nr:hypothetical protein [Chthoniobacterales bacterium]
MELDIRLSDLGQDEPERLSGITLRREYFFPLPVRDLVPDLSGVSFRIRVSPHLDARSSVGLEIGGRMVTEVGVQRGGGEQYLEAVLSRETLQEVGAEHFLKVTLVANLVPTSEQTKCSALAMGMLWVEVDPESGILCVFDEDSGDWLSVARLPFTLRRGVVMRLPEEATVEMKELALRLVCWAVRTVPKVQIQFKEGGEVAGDDKVGMGGSGFDEFVFVKEKSVSGGSARIEVKSFEGIRRIYLYGADAQDCASIWAAFRKLSRHRVPGSEWARLVDSGFQPAPRRRRSVQIQKLSRDFLSFAQGIGAMERRFRFDLTSVGTNPEKVVLRIKGRHKQLQRAGSAVITVTVNDNLIFTRDLELNKTEFEYFVGIEEVFLRPQNEVRVGINYTPDMEECKSPMFLFFWQMDPECEVFFEGEGDREDPRDLLSVAQVYYSSGSFDVLMEEGVRVGEVAPFLVWLQRVNGFSELEPCLVGEVLPMRPALVVGRFVGGIPGIKEAEWDFPLYPQEELLEFTADGIRGEYFRLTTREHLGIFQLGYRGLRQPVLWATYWGEGGERALWSLGEQLARLPWYGDADIVLGDGKVPPLAMRSTEF